MASVPLPMAPLTLNLSAAKASLFINSSSNNPPINSLCTVGLDKLGTNPKRLRSFVCRAASVTFRDLDADDFRHPLDRQVKCRLCYRYSCFCFCLPIIKKKKQIYSVLAKKQVDFGLLMFNSYVAQNTLLLRAIPGLNDIGKALLGKCFCLRTMVVAVM